MTVNYVVAALWQLVAELVQRRKVLPRRFDLTEDFPQGHAVFRLSVVGAQVLHVARLHQVRVHSEPAQEEGAQPAHPVAHALLGSLNGQLSQDHRERELENMLHVQLWVADMARQQLASYLEQKAIHEIAVSCNLASCLAQAQKLKHIHGPCQHQLNVGPFSC